MDRRQVGLLFLLPLLFFLPARLFAQAAENQIVDSATAVLQEIMATPANQIPHSLLQQARGLAIVPNTIKGGFVVGVRHGRGVVLLKDDAGVWRPPIFMTLTGGSVGWQAGVQSTDVILVFRTRTSLDSLLRGKLTLGVDAAAAAGPVGRATAAATDVQLQAEVLSYSRSRGLFAGLSIDGSSLQVDNQAGIAYYGRTGVIPAQGAVAAAGNLPPSAVRLLNQVTQYTVSPAPNQMQAAVPVAAPAPATGALDPRVPVVRQQLTEATQRLDALLDKNWKVYLAVPADAILAADRPTAVTALDKTLQRYDSVQADPRYADLTRRAEFTTVHRLLREYSGMVSGADAPRLSLPPPPESAGAPRR